MRRKKKKKITDSSKTEEGVAAAAVSTKRMNKPFTCRLPDDSSIYTAELRAILLALKHVCYAKDFFVVVDIIYFSFIVTVNIKPKI